MNSATSSEISVTRARNIGFRSFCRDHRVIQYRISVGEGRIPTADRLHEIAERPSLDDSRISRSGSFYRVGIHLHERKSGAKDKSETLNWSPHWSRGDRGAWPCSLVCICVTIAGREPTRRSTQTTAKPHSKKPTAITAALSTVCRHPSWFTFRNG
jgi:hypothetical protein